MHERRREPRARTFLSARIEPASGGADAPCLVTDLSTGGARIMALSAQPIPDTFHLALPEPGGSHAARTVWRRDGYAGVAFLEPRHAPPVLTDARRRT